MAEGVEAVVEQVVLGREAGDGEGAEVVRATAHVRVAAVTEVVVGAGRGALAAPLRARVDEQRAPGSRRRLVQLQTPRVEPLHRGSVDLRYLDRDVGIGHVVRLAHLAVEQGVCGVEYRPHLPPPVRRFTYGQCPVGQRSVAFPGATAAGEQGEPG